MASQVLLVIGATGNQGGTTASALLSAGATVRAFVRDPTSKASIALKSQGVEIFTGDMLDVESLRKAMVRVTGVFMNTIGPTAIQQAENVISTALQAGTVNTIVTSTAICTDRHAEWTAEDPNYALAPYYGSKYHIEDLVRKAGFKNYTILRPAWLMHTYHQNGMPGFHWPDLESKHEMAVSYAPTTKLGHLSPGDVGKFAAAALLNPEKFNKQEIDLAAENLTLSEVAGKLSIAAGVEITTTFRSEEEIRELDPSKVPGVVMQNFMAKIPTVFEADLSVTKRYGIKLTTFEEYFARETEKNELKRMLGVVSKED